MTHPATAGLTAVLVFAACWVAHQLADHWVQDTATAAAKGLPGPAGRWACARHVASYTATTLAFTLLVLVLPLGAHAGPWGVAAGQVWSSVTHYVIDRRTPLARVARRLGKTKFHDLGRPRPLRVRALPQVAAGRHELLEEEWVPLDQPTLGTGAYALDQSLHITCLWITALLTALL
jgi:hypothetical protein